MHQEFPFGMNLNWENDADSELKIPFDACQNSRTTLQNGFDSVLDGGGLENADFGTAQQR